VYGIGGSAQKPLLAEYAKDLAARGITLVYHSPGACYGYTAFTGTDRLTGTPSYWDSTGKELKCDAPAEGIPAQFGVAGVFPESCSGVGALPSNIGQFPGPVLGWNLIANLASTEQSISAEAAYLAFGLGADVANTSPWNDQAALVVRNPTSAAQLAIAAAINVPAAKFKGTDAKTNSGSVTGVQNATNTGAALGFVSSDVADLNRAKVKTLAYQHYGQACGYWPDSEPTRFDKVNVRNGQYFLWSQTHFIAPVDAGGAVGNANVKTFFDYALGAESLEATINSGEVPACAMNARRTTDIGDIQSFQPEQPCVGFFEFTATGATSRATCTDNAGCSEPTPVCRHGYCEVK
jgi:hypothetical protein